MKGTEGSMTNMRRGVEKGPSRDRKTLLRQLCFSFFLLLFSNFCFSLFASWCGQEWFPVCALRGSVELDLLPLGTAQTKIFHCSCGAGGAAPGPAAMGCTAAPAGNARQGIDFLLSSSYCWEKPWKFLQAILVWSPWMLNNLLTPAFKLE